jgi:hypothetical protein
VSRARAVPLAASLAGLLALAALSSACGSSGEADTTGVTLPSSLSVTTTVPGSTDTTAAAEPTTTSVPLAGPAADGAPVITALRAEPGSAGCVAGAIAAVVSFDVGPEPPIRVFSVFLDGAPAGSSNTAAPITIGAVPCDGGAHTVLFIATGTNGQSSTQAVAFRSPRPS